MPTDRGSFPGGGRAFSFHCLVEDCSADGLSSSRNRGLRLPRHEADHSPPSTVEIKNAWKFTITRYTQCVLAWCSDKAETRQLVRMAHSHIPASTTGHAKQLICSVSKQISEYLRKNICHTTHISISGCFVRRLCFLSRRRQLWANCIIFCRQAWTGICWTSRLTFPA